MCNHRPLKSKPVISVVMACYREPVAWLEQAIESILNQSFTDLELVLVVDDPNRAEIIECVQRYASEDPRVLVVKNDRNIGLPRSLNAGVNASAGAYLARMDADDISPRDRLKVQWTHLKSHPEIDLLGTAIENIDVRGRGLGVKQFPDDWELIRKVIPYCSVACHPTWLMAREVYDDVGGYRDLRGAEDYDFLYRAMDIGKIIGNLNQPLLQYRIHGDSITSVLSLTRYRTRQYIHHMHRERLEGRPGEFREDELVEYLNRAIESPRIAQLLTKMRKAETLGEWRRFLYLFALCWLSGDVRRRAVEMLKLNWTLLLHRA